MMQDPDSEERDHVELVREDLKISGDRNLYLYTVAEDPASDPPPTT
jgi:hypothetical protein